MLLNLKQLSSNLVNEVSPKCQGEGSTSIFTIQSDDEFVVIEYKMDGEGSNSQIDGRLRNQDGSRGGKDG